MKKFATTAAALVFCTLFTLAGGPDKITDINVALEKAKTENKMIFMQYGRDACGNCQALRELVSKKALRLSETKFVYADVNCDDPATSQIFRSKFKVTGNTLPFVVVVASDGTQLAARTGYGTEKEFEELIRDAQKAAKK